MRKSIALFLSAYLTLGGAVAWQSTVINSGSSLPTNCIVGGVFIKTGASAGFYTCLATNTWSGPYPTSAGSGDVTAAANLADNAVIRGDGGVKGIQDSAVTLNDSGAFSFPDGVKQTFNPDGTNAGFNPGSQAGDPSSLANGDFWYNSSANKFKCRENGATVDCITSATSSVGSLLDAVVIVKSADETVSASAALQSDDELNVSIGANESWIIEWTLGVEGNNAGDIKVAFNVPSGATGRWFGIGNNTSATTFSSDRTSFSLTDLTDTGAGTWASPGAGNVNELTLKVVVVNSSNAGNVTLRWAQANATNSTTVKASSYLMAYRIN